jgi:hypothetical protein
MNRKRLAKIRLEVQALVRSPQGRKANEFTSLAKRLGRERSKRGKEPTYVKQDDPKFTFPLSIPDHPGDLKIGTARSIAHQLLDDVDTWAQWLEQLEPLDSDSPVGDFDDT